MTTNRDIPQRAPKARRQRFSDRIEYRRGKADAERGRAPACFAAQYMAGYAEGRRAQSQSGARVAAR